MDLAVRTGSTKAPRDTSLSALSFESLHKETVLVLIEVQAKNRDAKTFEREVETVVRHALLETEGEASQRLDGTLKELNGLLKGLLVSQSIDDVHMVIAILDRESMLHVSHAGRSEAYLVRHGLASQITEYSTGKPTPAFVHIASGQLEKRDTLILSTQRLLRTMTPAQLAKTAEQPEPLDLLLKLLDTEGDQAALATLHLPTLLEEMVERERPAIMESLQTRRQRHMPPQRQASGGFDVSKILSYLPSWRPNLKNAASSMGSLKSLSSKGGGAMKQGASFGGKAMKQGASFLSRLDIPGWIGSAQRRVGGLMADLKHPQRRKRAHLLLVAVAVALLIVIWAMVHLFTSSQRSKTQAELEKLVQEINSEVQTADNRRIIGDVDAANAILTRAEEKAKTVMDNESGLFRMEALDLLDKIRAKKEEINNIVRLSPRVVANIAAKAPDVAAQGIVGVGEGELSVYDRQSVFRVVLNTVEAPLRVTEQDLVIDGDFFSRFQNTVYLTKGNSIIEVTNGQPSSMKTDDPAGWASGVAMHAYLRYLYILSPEKKQIYKYERLNNRYSAPVEYNVNGDLTGALDFAIDGNIFVLKQGGTIVNLLRGESKPFVIRNAPDGLLRDATKIYKVVDGRFYVLDPVHSRVIVLSPLGTNGDVSYVKQYVLEGDQVSELKDIYVSADDGQLYVLDGKRVHVIDLAN